MPKATRKPPDNLRPYLFHGVQLDWTYEAKEAPGICPFCGEDDKFSIKVATSEFNCFHGSCSIGGNARSFLQRLWNQSDRSTTDYSDLQDRGLQSDTFMRWGVCQSIVDRTWLVPGYDVKGKLQQLYRYVNTAKGKRLLPTPTFGHQLFGPPLYDKDKQSIYLCEGPWDAMALWEVLGAAKKTDDGLVFTANKEISLLADANVLAVPGCKVFNPKWSAFFSGKVANLMFDSDHPKKNKKTGLLEKPVGYEGMRRVGSFLGAAKTPPLEINYLRWGEKGYAEELPSGADVRDHLFGQ